MPCEGSTSTGHSSRPRRWLDTLHSPSSCFALACSSFQFNVALEFPNLLIVGLLAHSLTHSPRLVVQWLLQTTEYSYRRLHLKLAPPLCKPLCELQFGVAILAICTPPWSRTTRRTACFASITSHTLTLCSICIVTIAYRALAPISNNDKGLLKEPVPCSRPALALLSSPLPWN